MTLAAEGIGILLATPQPDFALAVADHVTVLTAGRITAEFSAAAVRANPDRLYAALAPATAVSRLRRHTSMSEDVRRAS